MQSYQPSTFTSRWLGPAIVVDFANPIHSRSTHNIVIEIELHKGQWRLATNEVEMEVILDNGFEIEVIGKHTNFTIERCLNGYLLDVEIDTYMLGRFVPKGD